MPSLDLTFLGTGTSHGIPVIGCDCQVCRSTDPRDHRTRTSLLVKAPDLHFVIDTSPDFRLQCLREGVSRLDAALFTHPHTDHVMGFDDMRRFCELQDLRMPVFASTATMQGLRNMFRYAFDDPQPWKNYLRLAPEVIDGPFRLGETEIIPVDLPHGKFTTTGYVFLRGGHKILAYFTDCSDVPPEAVEAARGVDVLVLDALRERPHPTHMTIAGALEAASAIGPADCYLTHLCHDVSHAALEGALPSGRHVAHDGLALTAGASR
jgi:phosphoribosyl 1,2-cyclic phosphate phosphodiesterase